MSPWFCHRCKGRHEEISKCPKCKKKMKILCKCSKCKRYSIDGVYITIETYKKHKNMDLSVATKEHNTINNITDKFEVQCNDPNIKFSKDSNYSIDWDLQNLTTMKTDLTDKMKELIMQLRHYSNMYDTVDKLIANHLEKRGGTDTEQYKKRENALFENCEYINGSDINFDVWRFK